MKRIGATVSAILLVGSLAGSAYAADNTIVKDDAGDGYCHMKFPAMTLKTLASDSPQLKNTQTGDVIDYYGPCDQTPTSQDQVISQKHDEEFSFGRNYEDGD